jgi:hypothetical protein
MNVEAERFIDRELRAPVPHLDSEALSSFVREAATGSVQPLHRPRSSPPNGTRWPDVTTTRRK